jgi:acetyl-CoA carboxylase biotin carboxylase subunit
MFSKVLIANRGEVAVRIIRACKELGLRTVAVYSEADKDSLHVKMADEAVCIGPPPPRESYLNIANIISAALVTGADAIHPGYGFLAEDPNLAEICSHYKIKFIGPPPEVIELLGNKIKARETVEKADVRVIPGHNYVADEKDAIRVARELGYPVVIKAAAGGGGRGMRVIHSESELVKAFAVARSESEAAFGDGTLYIEKYIEEPRHIEVQILADEHGNFLHLGERECSIQIRHQKLIEEAPSVVTESNVRLRERLVRAALRAAAAVGYVNAGTVEFLVDKNGEFYFIEMNTRLQVEHCVTEMVTGVDIVKEQIRIAAGERLSIRQYQVELRGHAIECRITAQDPKRDFMPSSGTITQFIPPGGPGVRVDTHIYSGYFISPYYDALLCKIIAHGRNRSEAIARMQRALDECILEGIKTTLPLHKRIINNTFFKRGETYTDFIQRHLADELKELE